MQQVSSPESEGARQPEKTSAINSWRIQKGSGDSTEPNRRGSGIAVNLSYNP